MINLRKIDCQNIGVFKGAGLKLDQHPLTVIRGKNLDVQGGTKRGVDSANRVGKSLIMSLIPTLRFHAPPTSKRKKSAKDVHGEKSAINLTFDVNDSSYVARQFTKGTSVNTTLTRNGKLLKYRKKDDVQAKIEKLMPQNEDQFYSLTYLDVRRQSKLQYGTDAERFEYFKNIFNLEIFDKIAKELNKEYNEVKYKAAQFAAYKVEYQERKAELPKLDVKEASKLLEETRLKVRRLSEKTEKNLRALEKISIFRTLAEGMNLKVTVKEIEQEITEAISDIKFLKQRAKEATEYWAKREEKSRIIKRRKIIKEKLSDIQASLDKLDINHTSEASLEKEIKKLETKCSDIEDEISAAESTNQNIVDAEEALKESEKGVSSKTIDKAHKLSLDTIKGYIQKASSYIETKEETLEFLKSQNAGHVKTCPVCSSGLASGKYKEIVQQVSEDLKKAKGQIASLKKAKGIRECIDSLEALGSKADIASLNKRLAVYTKILGRLNKALKLVRTQQKGLDLLKELKIPKIKETGGRKEAKPEVFIATMEETQQRLYKTQDMLERRKRLAQLKSPIKNMEDADYLYEMASKAIEKYKPMLEVAQSKLTKLTDSIAAYRTVRKDLVRLRGKMEEMGDIESEFKIYSALRKAYGANGLRKVKIKEISKAIEKQMNDLAHLIYAEPITFKFNVTDTKFDVLATRNGKTGDVRTLSNSESRAFVMLLFMALVPFIPAEQRFNILVMDEMEAGLDTLSKRLFVENFLPELQRIVPHVFVITPQSKADFNVLGAHTLVVTKKDGVSTIEVG